MRITVTRQILDISPGNVVGDFMTIPADPAVLPEMGRDLDVDQTRMTRMLAELARFTAPGPGVTRTGLSPEEARARHHLAAACRRDGLVTHVDQATNLIVRRPGADPDKPVVLIGSHLDTVVGGGRLDGTYGVVAACEVLRVLAAARVELPAEPVAIAFTNEEGAGFPYPFLGSLAVTGGVDVAKAAAMTDRHGRSLPDAMRAAGGDLDTIGAAAWAPGSIACFLEPHIEQGPVLESEDVPIGVVDAITGRTILDITIRGDQGHAGTTPMSARHDALASAAQVILAVEKLAARDQVCTVGTVGVLDVHPGVTNVIPGVVQLTAEIRDGRPECLYAAENELTATLTEIAATTGVGIEVDARPVSRPTATSEQARETITAAATALGLPYRHMFSGAGHDAQILAEIAPIGMIFVPSHRGVSHVPDEHTADTHLTAGARTLLHTVLRLCP
jgi:beta-ureidopropionase / N-carbamoyl-L-amino-acid hydrolase